ncbi:WxL domain-containing protein [Enterococcus sp. DIV0876]|uniref:WxL domain-containing protein n=1 Tax=Enterococcus sp. DIV0876 TaxID=2774633 RepID=UPI003D3013D2
MSITLLQTTANAAEYSSNGAISFEADTNPTNPVDPTDPEKPVDPVDPTDPDGPNQGTAGPLSIDFASSFQFGDQLITSETKDYYAQLQSFASGESGPNYVQVTDKRGTQEGWSLSVIQNGQFKTAENEELNGAALSIAAGATTSITDMQYAPTVTASHTFVPNSEVTLVNAPVGKGMGTWIYKFGNDAAEGATAVKLNVPGRSVKLAKEYRTTLTWNLKNVPDNTDGN